ncbi:MAG: electron transport complex subunit RsxC [Firmicutes bacterium]|nr:electron transport complex subunit RsxC [Bacillota bacterium]
MKELFRGGVHPQDHKDLSRSSPLRAFDWTGEMVFPLAQHIGKPAKVIVSKGDRVLAGQCIGEADGFVSANVICSCSGTVKAIEKRRTIAGTIQECVVVDGDGLFELLPGVGEECDVYALSGEEILKKIADAGVIGLGGAGFPTRVKLSPKDPSAIRYLIANGAECEPYLCCNDQLMRSCPEEIVKGMELMLRLFPNAKGVVAIEDNKPEAIAAMKVAAASHEGIVVMPMKTKYPQGGERSLIKAVAGIDYPASMLPADVGCIVCNVGTIYASYRAVAFNEPLFRHVLTVSGEDVVSPCNLIVRDGTPFSALLEEAGGLKEGAEPKKALAGGPMMGVAVASLDVPVVKTTNALTILSVDPDEGKDGKYDPCISCGRCGSVCPNGLMPMMMMEAAENGDWERYEKKLYGLECFFCGSCSYICPAKRPLTQTFKLMKAEILAKKRAEAAGGKK